jgi:hypothetical protein
MQYEIGWDGMELIQAPHAWEGRVRSSNSTVACSIAVLLLPLTVSKRVTRSELAHTHMHEQA